MVHWTHVSQFPKRHLDQFNRHTDHSTPSVAIGRILCTVIIIINFVWRFTKMIKNMEGKTYEERLHCMVKAMVT